MEYPEYNRDNIRAMCGKLEAMTGTIAEWGEWIAESVTPTSERNLRIMEIRSAFQDINNLRGRLGKLLRTKMPQVTVRLGHAQEVVMEYLDQKYPEFCSPTQIGKDIYDHHSAWGSRICLRLVQLGLAERNEHGHYCAVVLVQDWKRNARMHRNEKE